jgi:hypothetical protein
MAARKIGADRRFNPRKCASRTMGIALSRSTHYESAPQAQRGVNFSPRVVCTVFISERGLPMSKSIALSLVLAASLGLAACSKGEENAANASANAAENASNAADNAMNAAENAASNAANAASNVSNTAENAASNAM